ncbi:MAG: glycoside hydrolase family 127 protein [Chitinophagaceae bacterium]|nr:glycoside hydrolase family 127 protein [Chitinophagaceae bacterium]
MIFRTSTLITSILAFSAACPIFGQTSISPVSFKQVRITDSFWAPRIEINRTVTIPSSFQKCEETGRVENFVKAAKRQGKFLTTFPFDDTDIYKTIEGASFSMSVHPDVAMDRYVDSLITLIAAAQEPDGYLYTARTIDPAHPHEWSGPERWVKESVLSHELYNAGHLYEAATAHYRATGKRNFLDVAVKNADLLVKVFGPAPGQRNDAPGHEIVEMGLVSLYRVTGEKKYLDLASFFIDSRGKKNDPARAYWQDATPVVRQDEAVGHAVRACYLYSGVADVASLTDNKDYLLAIDRIWDNMVSKKYYITGGIGARPDGEAFGGPYELPNLTAYNETCAAIANVYWNYRMFLLHGESKYIDVLERSLYNGLISGVGLDGKTFFYPNPLQCDASFKFNRGSLTRQPWFDCSCCPTNLCRFLPSVPGYIYAQQQDRIYINLFVNGTAQLEYAGQKVQVSQETRYPWDGQVRISVDPGKEATLAMYIRVPGWAMGQPAPGGLYRYAGMGRTGFVLKVNGKPVAYTMDKGYAVINRQWKKGDFIEYKLPMDIHQVRADERVVADTGKIAIERGPIVFCFEAADNTMGLDSLTLQEGVRLSAEYHPGKLNGIVEIHGVSGGQAFTAIPYCVWDNRGMNKMKVWVTRR